MQYDRPFTHTDAWENLTQQVEAQALQSRNNLDLDDLTNELKLSGRFAGLKHQAMARHVVLEVAQKHQLRVTPEQLQSTLQLFSEQRECVKQGQIDFHRLSQWFESQQLDLPQFDQLMHRQAMLNWMETVHHQVDEALIDILRLNDEFGLYRQRVEDKKKQRRAAGRDRQSLADAGLTTAELWQWYFQFCLNRTQPADINGFAKANGFSDINELQQAVLGEYYYIHS